MENTVYENEGDQASNRMHISICCDSAMMPNCSWFLKRDISTAEHSKVSEKQKPNA